MCSGLENQLEDKVPADHLNFRMDKNGKGLKSIKKLEICGFIILYIWEALIGHLLKIAGTNSVI